MMRHLIVLTLLIFVFHTSCKGQIKPEQPEDVKTSLGPISLTRSIMQDRNGNIWTATWDGIFKYDGKSFTNMTSGVSKARFFSVLEDRKGTLWFGTIGSGVFSFDGKEFLNITTKEGLINNEVGWIYEDKAGNIWFGENGGASRYDGKSVRNFMMNGDVMAEDKTGKKFPDFTRPPNEVTSIIEDKTGKLWFGTRGNTFVYDARLPDGQGNKFSVLIHDGKPFTNVRTIIEDRTGNIWLGGNDGVWRYDGKNFTNVTTRFCGSIYEDKKGNIWTCSASIKQGDQNSVLFRYDANSLSNKTPTATELKPGIGALFGILEANDGRIWVATGNGVYRYDGINFERP